MTVNGIDIEVEKKPIKDLHLAVYPPDVRVHVSVVKMKNPLRVGTYSYTTNSGMHMTVPVLEGDIEEIASDDD